LGQTAGGIMANSGKRLNASMLGALRIPGRILFSVKNLISKRGSGIFCRPLKQQKPNPRAPTEPSNEKRPLYEAVDWLYVSPDRAHRLSETKILGGFTTPELNERLVHKLLVEGHYARHAAQLRKRILRHRIRICRFLATQGIEVLGESGDGLFVWANMRTDTNELAAICSKHGLLLAPGSLFSPRQEPSDWMRINVTTSVDDIRATLAKHE